MNLTGIRNTRKGVGLHLSETKDPTQILPSKAELFFIFFFVPLKRKTVALMPANIHRIP